MSNSALKDAFEKAMLLPKEDQAAAAGLLEDFVEQYNSGLRLTSEQVEEIRRRMADPNPEYATEEEVGAFFKRGLHED
jgi:Mg2+ and Co2+ transporter CorA